MRMLLLILISLCLSAPATMAQDVSSSTPTPGVNFGSLKRTGVGRVDQVLDGLTILLKDNKIIRLSSLDIPDFAYPEGGTFNMAAKEALGMLLPSGSEVLIYQTRKAKVGRTNRMGQELAHLVKKDGEIWINGELVRHGYARAMPSDANPDMTEELYAMEEQARAKNLALWGPDGWPVLSPDNAAEGIGEYRLVVGTVESAATVKNNLYLNFGKNWKEDFTVMVPPSVRRDLARRGIDPQSLTHHKIRARGFIRSYNGPYMELENDLRLEFADPAATIPHEQGPVPANP